MDALDKAIAHFGKPHRPANLAKALDVDPMTVRQWRKRGVPAERVLEIVIAVKGEVTAYELRPDIYPDPEWVPPELRAAAA